jgi:hypothetical protein
MLADGQLDRDHPHVEMLERLVMAPVDQRCTVGTLTGE